MRYIKNKLEFNISEPCVISLGKFDGLHAGHRYLMEEMEKGQREGLKSVVFTFDIPPKSVYENEYKVLSTNEEKMHIFSAQGVDYLIECPFTQEFRQMSPREFLEMLTDKINVRKIVAGTDFCFGYKRSGTYEHLKKYASEFGYEAIIVNKKQFRGEDISSTRIRKCIAAGNMEEANELLGYTYFMSGEVLHGNEIGRTIGFPTANLIPPEEKLLPPNGVYAVEVKIEDQIYTGISNIGCKPTISGDNPIGVETFVFDFSGDLYGKNIHVYFYQFIRREQKFDSLDSLKRQMEKDIVVSRQFFKKK